MPRLQNAAGVVVNVSSATAKTLQRRGFQPVAEAEPTKAPAKKAAPRKSTK